ncbi:hypothetical protein HDU92_004396 [Lobulomyces angularis]|nr:hypothetical protein HDU92_004396 [Lobulomyces angularis]
MIITKIKKIITKKFKGKKVKKKVSFQQLHHITRRESAQSLVSLVRESETITKETEIIVEKLDGDISSSVCSKAESNANLLYSLALQLEIQENIVNGIIEFFKENDKFMKTIKINDSFFHDPKYLSIMLSNNSQQIRKTVKKLVRKGNFCISHGDIKKNSNLMWEDIVKSFLENKELSSNSNVAKEPVVLPIPQNKTNVQNLDIINSDCDEVIDVVSKKKGPAISEKQKLCLQNVETDDEEFVDALEFDSTETSTNKCVDNLTKFNKMPTHFEVLENEKNHAVEQKSEKGEIKCSYSVNFESKAKSDDSPKIITLDELEKNYIGHKKVVDRRKCLKLNKHAEKPGFNMWSFLKSAIGKELSKVTLPVLFNEPLSMLQRMSEDVEYIELLFFASRIGNREVLSDLNHPVVKFSKGKGWKLSELETLSGEEASMFRLALVSAFAVSNYSSTVGRSGKPFNPMLGETFEFVDNEKRFRMLSEQVCHHPPISACHLDSPDFEFFSEVNVKSKFWGKSLEITPLGNCHVKLKIGNRIEHFSWKKVVTSVHNLILGPLMVDHTGEMIVKNWSTGESCVLNFNSKRPTSYFSWSTNDTAEINRSSISGNILDANGISKFEIAGNWEKSLYLQKIQDSNFYSTSPLLKKKVLIWKKTDQDLKFNQNIFNLSGFAITLNELTVELESRLPKSDSRLRRDQIALEEGKWNDADVLKSKLENLQRERRKKIAEKFEIDRIPDGPPLDKDSLKVGEEWWNPRWFSLKVDEDTGENFWEFKKEYWEYRSNNNFPDYVPNLFKV